MYFHYYLWVGIYCHSPLWSEKLLFTTMSRNVSIVRIRISPVTILLLDLVMSHWIRLIQRKSFRENSNSFFSPLIDESIYLSLEYFTTSKRSGGEVMFLHVYVCSQGEVVQYPLPRTRPPGSRPLLDQNLWKEHGKWHYSPWKENGTRQEVI